MSKAELLLRLRLLHHNWAHWDSHAAIVLDLFRGPGAKSLVRAGFGEQQILDKQHSIAPELAEAIAHADCIGLRYHKGSVENSIGAQRIIELLRENYAMEIDKSVPIIDAWLFQFVPELVGQLAAGKRVLWITSDAEVIVKNLADPDFRDFYGLHDITGNDWICAAQPAWDSPFPENISAEQAFKDIQKQLAEARDFDLALVGVGVVGKLICHHIKTTLGKSAIDVGVFMSYTKGSRERDQLNPGSMDDGEPSLHYLVWDPASQSAPHLSSRPESTQCLRNRLAYPVWAKLDSHAEIVLDLFRGPGAKSLVRAGFGEQQILDKQHSIAPELAEAMAHADCIGLRHHKGSVENSRGAQRIIELLRENYAMEIDKSVPIIDVWLFQFIPELVGELAAGKRVLWITSDAEVIVRNLADPAFRDFYGLHKIAGNDWINVAEPAWDSPFPKNISAEQALEDVRRQLTAHADFDLALVRAGVVGKLICHHIKTTLGKSAIDVGVFMSYVKGSRERDQLNPGVTDTNESSLNYLVWNPASQFAPHLSPRPESAQFLRNHLPHPVWEKLDSHAEIVFNLFRGPGAKSLVRTGHREKDILSAQCSIASGLAEAIKHADCLGLKSMGLASEVSRSMVDLLHWHHKVEIDKSAHVSSGLFIYVPELVGRLAQGKRVLWITSDADVIVRNLADPGFRDFYGLHEIAGNAYLNVAEGEAEHFPEEHRCETIFEDIVQQLAGVGDFDLALVGAGLAGKLACHHIKTTLGKSAIDVGMLMTYLRGSCFRARLCSGEIEQYSASPAMICESASRDIPRAAQLLRQCLWRRNWEQFDAHADIVLDLFNKSGAKSLISTGRPDRYLLQTEHPVAPRLAEAIRHADCVGVHGLGVYGMEHSPASQAIASLLRQDHKIEINKSLQVSSFLFSHFPELVGKLAAGKRVLWIALRADLVVAHLANPDFRDYNGLHGIADNDWINVAAEDYMPAFPENLDADQSLDNIRRRLTEAQDFDLALVGAGVVGKLVCHHIKTNLGKSAIDIGDLMARLVG